MLISLVPLWGLVWGQLLPLVMTIRRVLAIATGSAVMAAVVMGTTGIVHDRAAIVRRHAVRLVVVGILIVALTPCVAC